MTLDGDDDDEYNVPDRTLKRFRRPIRVTVWLMLEDLDEDDMDYALEDLEQSEADDIRNCDSDLTMPQPPDGLYDMLVQSLRDNPESWAGTGFYLETAEVKVENLEWAGEAEEI